MSKNLGYMYTKYKHAKKFLDEHGIQISTTSLECNLHTQVYIQQFAQYVPLDIKGIISIKYGNRNNLITNRMLPCIKKYHKNGRNFYNQATILISPYRKYEKKYVNIKVFQNGTLQITGCKDMDQFYWVTTKLIKILYKGATIDHNGKKTHIKFVKDPDQMGIYDVKIRMINSNFKIDYRIDRKRLYVLLIKNHHIWTTDKEIGYVECENDSVRGHSCVNIKCPTPDQHKTSIFIFQTGSIIITGAKKFSHIIHAYKYVQKILKRYYREIRIIDLDPQLVRAEIKKYQQIKKLERN